MIPYWSSVLDISTFGMMNMQWNYGLEKLRCNQSYMLSNPFMPSMDFLIDPRFTIWQINQQRNQQQFTPWNTGWNSFDNWNQFNPWENNSNPWNPWGNNNGNGGGSKKNATQKELDKFKEVFESLKKINEAKSGRFIDNELIDEYQDALKEKNDEDKLEAVKEVFKKISADKIRKAVLEQKDFKIKLAEIGYDFANSNETIYTKVDTYTADINKLDVNLKNGKYDILDSTASMFNQDKYNIIDYLSQWNEKHTDKDSRSIIRLISAKLPSKDIDKHGLYEGINNMTQALLNKTSELDISEDKLKAVKDALVKVNKELKADEKDAKVNTSALKSALNTLADKFETLYLQIRMNQAAGLNEKVRTKYEKELNSVIPGCIPEDIVISGTKKDLESEGFSTSQIPAASLAGDPDIDPVQNTYETPEKRVEALLGKRITEVQASKENKFNGIKIYKSLGKKLNGYRQYFIIKDGELVKLKGYVTTDGKLYDETTQKAICDLKNVTSDNYETISDSDILTTDEAKPSSSSSSTTDDTETKIDSAKKSQKSDLEKNAKKIAEEDGGAYDLGAETALLLIGFTNGKRDKADSETKQVLANLHALDKDNVLDFVRGYRAHDGGGNGLFEQIASEWTSQYKNKDVLPVMKAVLDAIPSQYHDTDKYKEMQRIYRHYSLRLPNETFEEKLEDHGFLGIYYLFGTDNLDNFDENLYDLLDEIYSGDQE